MHMTLGLALGGGAAKGYIHLGVFKYLEENNIQIDALSGTSMGAIVGAMIAKGMRFDEIYDAVSSFRYTDLLDLDISQGLIKGGKFLAKLEQYIGASSFDDLMIPLSIAATNILTGEEKIFRHGSVLEAVRASMSLPGIFTLATLSDQGDGYFVDGGLTNNLPVSHLSSDRIIAVSCQGMGDFKPVDYQEIWGKKFDTTWLTLPKRVVYRSLNIMMRQLEDTYIKNDERVILLRPDLSSISAFDIDALDDAIDIGYTVASEVLGEYFPK